MFVKFIENFLTNDECDSMILIGESIGLTQMKSSLIVNGKLIEENVEYGGNKRMGCYFIEETLNHPTIQSLTKKIIELSNELNPFNGVVYNGVQKYSFNRYGIGDFLDWHPDNHEILNGATITFIIQLNDNYEDGHVKYMNNGIEETVVKKRGSVFIFDSNILHSVDKISEGNRYSINVWPHSMIKKTLI